MGNEDEEDAIYVMLEDCTHIFESTDLNHWMELDGDEIKAKVCPRCKTTIKRSGRYNNVLKRNMQDLVKVKTMSYGTDKENRYKQIISEQKLSAINEENKLTLGKYTVF